MRTNKQTRVKQIFEMKKRKRINKTELVKSSRDYSSNLKIK